MPNSVNHGRSNTAIGESPLYLHALDHASRLATLDRPTLVLGERGSGKELIAHRLHFLSPRWDEPFLKVNCAALTENLVESTLFGHEAGAFTGATRGQAGYFERVGAGTLFLDEIATLTLRTQEKLLRVLEYGEYERLGGQKTLTTQARIVAATHGDLPAMAENNDFRHDLLDRLAFDLIHMPPLRRRDQDALLLAEHFAMAFIGGLGWDYFPGFSKSAQKQILDHNWPGNVRELKNAIERSLFRATTGEQPVDDILLDPFTPPWQPTQSNQSRENESIKPITDTSQPFDFKAERQRWEQAQLQAALTACEHHQGRAAAHMGLSYDQLRALVKRLRITDE